MTRTAASNDAPVAKFVLQHQPETFASGDGHAPLRAGFGCTSKNVQGELNE